MIGALLPAPTSRSAGDPPYQPFLRNSWAAAAFRCGAGRRRDSSKAPPIVVVGPPHRHFSGLDRSMRDRGERGTVPNKLHGESRAWVHDSAAPSPGPVSGSERSATQLTLPACQTSAGTATSGQGRQPRSGGAGRDRLYRMAPVWPYGDKQVTTLGTLTAPTPVSCRNSIRCHQHRA